MIKSNGLYEPVVYLPDFFEVCFELEDDIFQLLNAYLQQTQIFTVCIGLEQPTN